MIFIGSKVLNYTSRNKMTQHFYLTIEREYNFQPEIVFSCDLDSKKVPKIKIDTAKTSDNKNISSFSGSENNINIDPLSTKFLNSPNSLRIPGEPVSPKSIEAILEKQLQIGNLQICKYPQSPKSCKKSK